MVKVCCPPHVFTRSHRTLRIAYDVLEVYNAWCHHLAIERQQEMRRQFVMERMGHQLAMQRGYNYAMQQCTTPRRFQFSDSGSGSDMSEEEAQEKSSEEDEEEEEEDCVRFEELSPSEEDETFHDYRHFLQRQAQRAEMEALYGQRFQAPEEFDQMERQRSFTSRAVDTPSEPQLLYNQAPASTRLLQY